MKYFGIGLSKTATSSLEWAMRDLGFRAKHYLREYEYQDLLNGKPAKNRLQNSMSNYDFFDDLPIPMRYKELDERFPNSKFIYTNRDIDQWLDSCKAHWERRGKVTTQNWPNYRIELFGQLNYDADVFRNTYVQHKLEVVEYFKDRPDDFLIMDICAGDGWEVLCPFIGRAAPSKPFPHKNIRR